jgi:Hypothetical glycosyl hydrolase 6/Beta-galactosidase trimerisation domain
MPVSFALESNPWFKAAYRRAVIDMHIPDWDDAFLSRLDVESYAAMLVRARAQSVVAYAMSHVGLFNYPTKVGRQHRNLRGRNVVQEILDRCHAQGIAVVLYNSLVFDRTTADLHPEWRMRAADGSIPGKGGRHGLLCPNSPYREYVRAWVEEECRLFDPEGFRFDMTFWPAVCYCDYCKARFAADVGGPIPTTIDWLNEKWVAFERCRESWLGEFAAIATETVRKLRPRASVEHQSSTFPAPWTSGVNFPLVARNDFLQGDFYGDSWQGSFVRKLLEDLTPNRPFGFETSVSVELGDHTAMKPRPLLEAKAAAALADNAAFIFIDAIDPIGTLNPKVYDRMGGIFDGLRPLYPELGGMRVADVALYYSLDSKFDFAGNGRPVTAADTSDAHTRSVTAVTRLLGSHHVPFGFIMRSTLSHLSDHKLLILANVNMMDDPEIDAIREWVRHGGRLLATGWTSLVDTRGRLRKDFALGDALGVTLRKPSWAPWPHYIAPKGTGETGFADFSASYPAFAKTTGQKVAVTRNGRVLATTTLIWRSDDPSRFASIHSNPPWQPTDRPEVVMSDFGKGRCVYCASPVEIVEPLGSAFVGLIRRLQDRFTFEADAPASVELTLFYQPERHRYRLTLVNFEKELPNIPVTDVAVRLRLKEQVAGITELPTNRKVAYQESQGVVRFTVSRLETLAMFAVVVA